MKIDTYVECDTFNTEKFKGIPFLDVASTYSKKTKAVFINVVNRHKEKAITAEIINSTGQLIGKAEAHVVNTDSLDEPFTFEKQDKYVPMIRTVEFKGNTVSFSFPAHSFTQIKAGVKVKS